MAGRASRAVAGLEAMTWPLPPKLVGAAGMVKKVVGEMEWREEGEGAKEEGGK